MDGAVSPCNINANNVYFRKVGKIRGDLKMIPPIVLLIALISLTIRLLGVNFLTIKGEVKQLEFEGPFPDDLIQVSVAVEKGWNTKLFRLLFVHCNVLYFFIFLIFFILISLTIITFFLPSALAEAGIKSSDFFTQTTTIRDLPNLLKLFFIFIVCFLPALIWVWLHQSFINLEKLNIKRKATKKRKSL